MAGRETRFLNTRATEGKRIAVIGAGPAGLSYAALAATRNSVTVFERESVPGGTFRLAGLAPMFQEVEAAPQSLQRFIAQLAASCERSGVSFRLGTDVLTKPGLLAPFDIIVVATGARYRFGLGAVAARALGLGLARWPGAKQLFSAPRFRDWFYYRARWATGERFRALARARQEVVVIDDARKAGNSKDAIQSAFDAAYGLQGG